jgi:hypothetical protein
VLFEIWFIIICLMVVAGIIFRLLPRNLLPVQLHKVAPKAASQLVAEFITASYDGEFGYPSGMFVIDSATESKIIAREAVEKGSHFTQAMAAAVRAVNAAMADSATVSAIRAEAADLLVSWLTALVPGVEGVRGGSRQGEARHRVRLRGEPGLRAARAQHQADDHA